MCIRDSYHSVGGRTVGFTKSDTGVTTWMHADQVNSTSVTRDENGVVSTQRYTPFGELRTDGSLGTDRGFTGQVADLSTGLSFYNARYYDPIVGRFVSPDTIVPNPGNGQDLNRYSYVRNNPIRWDDPTGNCVSYEPCTGSDDEPTTTDLSNTSFGGPAAPDDGVPWYNNLLGVVGTCVAGTGGCTEEPLAELHPELAQGVVNASAGYLDPVTGGLAEDFIHEDIYIEEDHWTYAFGNVTGEVAAIGLEFNPVGRIYAETTSGLNVAVDCTQATQGGSNRDCGVALADMAIGNVARRAGNLDTSAAPTSRVQTGDGWGADLAANWGSNLGLSLIHI